MAAGLGAGAGSLGGAIWGAGTSAEAETGGEEIELGTIGEQATQDENTPLLGTGRAGRPKKWKSGWSRLLNRQKTRNYYKNFGSNRGASVPITKPGYISTAAGDVVEEPNEQTPLTPKQQEVRNRVSGRPFRSYQYTYDGKRYHTTNEELARVYNQGIQTQRNPVQYGDDHRFGSIPAKPELPYYPYTLNQNYLNPALQMSHIRSTNQMFNKQGQLTKPNYKWLRNLGLRPEDDTYVRNLKRQRNQQKRPTPTVISTPTKRKKIEATVENTNTYDRGTATPQRTVFSPQVRSNGEIY